MFKVNRVLQLWLCMGVCAIILSACSKKIVTPISSGGTGAFVVQGSKIIDPAGNEFIAKGVNVNGPYWPWTRPTIPDVSLITDVWKFNTVRVDTWPEFNIYNNNNTDLDGIVNAFTAKKVVSVIEDHNFTGRYPNAAELDTLTNWWVSIAAKYKGNPYVWFNIMNEPGVSGAAPADWLNTHDAVIKAIRNAGANNILFVTTMLTGRQMAIQMMPGVAYLLMVLHSPAVTKTLYFRCILIMNGRMPMTA